MKIEFLRKLQHLTLPSPVKLEVTWKRQEQICIRWWQDQAFIFLLIAAVTLILPIRFFKHYLFIESANLAGGLAFVQTLPASLEIIILASVLLLLTPPRFRKTARFIAFFTVAAAASTFLYHRLGLSLSLKCGLISICLPSLLSYGALRFIPSGQRQTYRLLAIYLGLSFALIFGMAYWFFAHHLYGALRIQALLNPTFLVVSTSAIILSRSPRMDASNFSFSMSHILRGIPWPLETKSPSEDFLLLKKLWWQGAMNIALGYFQLLLRVWLDAEFLIPASRHDTRKFSFAIGYYVVVLLTNIAYLNILTGVLRITGFQVPDATDFKWLSRTPSEFWRRGNVYLYSYVLRFVYLPVLRKLRSVKIALLVSFSSLFFYKVGLLSPLFVFMTWWNPTLHPVFQDRRLEIQLFRWSLWLLVILAFRKRWPFGPGRFNHPWLSWASILFTHFLMVSIYFLSLRLRFFLR